MNKMLEKSYTLAQDHNIDKSLVDYLYNYVRKNNLNDDVFEDYMQKLLKNIPVQYIVGNVDFCGNIIEVNKDVLIPRFETELLVEKTIKYIKDMFDKKINILDIGTGSGAIAITLKKKLDCDVVAVDISKEALEVAKKNALNNKVDIKFIYSDLFQNINEKFDVIMSNPPYISYDEEIMDIVKNNEPEIALYAKDNGLYYYDKILKDVSLYLKDEFLIAFEIGYKQADAIRLLAYKYLGDVIVYVLKDYSDKDRFIFIKNLSK